MIDTLRADHLGCYGYDRDTSPNIDGLAARGVRFEQAVAQSSWTAPSMVSLLQSKHLGADFVRKPPGPTLAERLAEAGYRCVAFQDNILLAPGTGFDRGCELYEVEAGPAKIIPALRRDDPRPLLALREQESLWDEAEISRRVDEAARHMAVERARYDGDVRQTDARVGFVLSMLEKTGRSDQAYVVLAADHGECLWEQREAPSQLDDDERSNLLRLFKMSHNTVLYESLTRTPLLMVGPDLPPGILVDEAVENVDIVPTMLELLGLQGGQECDTERTTWSNTALFTAATSPRGLKLIRPWDPAGGDPVQLFELTDDPAERRPLPLEGQAWRTLQRAIDNYRHAPLMPAEGEGLLDEAVAERMRQLGYLGR